jgi:hypothetical protein
MTRRLLTGLTITALAIALVARADDTKQDKGDKVDPKAASEVTASKTSSLQRQFSDFEGALMRLKQRLSESPRQEDRQKAIILQKALETANKEAVDVKFSKLVQLVQDSKTFADLNKIQQAIDYNQQLMEDVKLILNILLTDNRDEQLREERKRVEEMLRRLNQIIRDQQAVRAWTDRAQMKKDNLAKQQNNVAKDTDALAKGQPKPAEDKETRIAKADFKDPKDIDGKRGEGKEDTKDNKIGDKTGDAKEAESKPGDAKQGDGKEDQKGDSKSGDSKPGDDDKKGNAKGGDGKDDKKGDAKSGDGKDDKKADAKAGDSKQGDKGDAKPAEKKEEQRVASAKDAKATDPKSDSKPGDGKPSDAKPSDSKGKGDGKSEAKPGDGKSGKQSQSAQAKSGQSGQQGQQGDGKDDQPQQAQKQQKQQDDQGSTAPARKKIAEAYEKMKAAEQKIKVPDNEKATQDQTKAIEDLEAAKKKLEDLLRQLRQEEIERLLAALQMRCERMLAMQIEVRDGTIKVFKEIETHDGRKAERADQQASNKLSDKEEEIVREANKAISILTAEGSAVAFPEVFTQVRDDMVNVARRLRATDVSTFTQRIENDIIATLQEMIEALKKARQDNQNKQPPPPGQGGGQNQQKLIELLQELKMIRSLQIRVNKRTEDYSREYQGEQAPPIAAARSPEEREKMEIVNKELKNLSDRQKKIGEITDNLRKNLQEK